MPLVCKMTRLELSTTVSPAEDDDDEGDIMNYYIAFLLV